MLTSLTSNSNADDDDEEQHPQDLSVIIIDKIKETYEIPECPPPPSSTLPFRVMVYAVPPTLP